MAHLRPCCLTTGPALRDRMAEEGKGGGGEGGRSVVLGGRLGAMPRLGAALGGTRGAAPSLGAAWGLCRAGCCPAVRATDGRQAGAVPSQPGSGDPLMASGGAWIYDESGLRFAGCRRLRDVAGATQAQGMIGAIRSIDPKWAGDTYDPGEKKTHFSYNAHDPRRADSLYDWSAFLILKFYIPILNSINQWSG